jgi:hypothetical protein
MMLSDKKSLNGMCTVQLAHKQRLLDAPDDSVLKWCWMKHRMRQLLSSNQYETDGVDEKHPSFEPITKHGLFKL